MNIILVIIFSLISTKPQVLNIVLSKLWLQRRLIGVEYVEEGDRIFPLELGGLFTTAEIERRIMFTSDQCGPSANILDKLNVRLLLLLLLILLL